MTLEQRVYDAEKAKNVLENEVFQQVFADIEKDLVEKWKSSSNAEDRERLHQYLQLLNLLKVQLNQTLESGKLAQAQLTHEKSLREKLSKTLDAWL